jgi:undecaprenyl-diphosphatase
MIVLLQAIRSIDVSIYHYFNEFAGNRILDYLASFEENADLFKGALFLAIFWYFWFRPSVDQDKQRRAIVAIMVGAVLALIASRTIADLAPFRVRPMYDLHLEHRPYSLPISPRLVNWSAFPSDTAALFFALAFGLVYLSRRIAVPMIFYLLAWICLPRLYLGVHYASDLVAGAALGISMEWLTMRVEWLWSGLVTPLLALEKAKPKIFYPAAFLVSFEIGTLFDDVRVTARTLFHVVRGNSVSWLIHAEPVAFAVLVFLAIAAFLVFPGRRMLSPYFHRHSHSAGGPPQNRS